MLVARPKDKDGAVDAESVVDVPGDQVSDSSDEDTYTLSARTQNTVLPGTPDYVLDEAQEAEDTIADSPTQPRD